MRNRSMDMPCKIGKKHFVIRGGSAAWWIVNAGAACAAIAFAFGILMFLGNL